MHYDEASADEPVMEVRIINDYGDDMMGQAMFLSLPSLYDGLCCLSFVPTKKEGRSWIDSTPSYVWASSSSTDEEAWGMVQQSIQATVEQLAQSSGGQIYSMRTRFKPPQYYVGLFSSVSWLLSR